MPEIDLRTTYLGLDLCSPLISSAGPQSTSVESVQELADAGVGAIVMYSLYEEQLRSEAARDLAILDAIEDTSAEALSFFPDVVPHDEGVSARYLRHLRACVEAVDIPVIGSLNGSSLGAWTEYARQMQDVGAAAVELNIYVVPGTRGVAGAEVEKAHLDILEAVKKAVTVPVAVKLSPYFSSTGDMCRRLDEAGADGLVLFNRFVQPDVDIEAVTVTPGIELSSPSESRLPRTWIALLRGRVSASLAGTSGVHSGADLAKYLLSGADVACSTSALLARGPAHAWTILDELRTWITRKELTSLEEVRGLLVGDDAQRTSSYQRAGYLAALEKGKQQYGRVV